MNLLGCLPPINRHIHSRVIQRYQIFVFLTFINTKYLQIWHIIYTFAPVKQKGNQMIDNFTYWAKHWAAFNKTALALNCWKIRFIFHDWEKPWMQMIMSHDKVSKLHRIRSRHHVEFVFPKYYDYLSMVIDWECARVTKPSKPLNAKETCDKYYPQLKDKIYPILK